VSRFVASFIGKCNFIEGRVVGEGRFETAAGRAAETGDKLLVTAASTDAGPVGPAGAKMQLAWRPEDCFVVA
jgi:ABC-type Fe3+/spermidine/putrescine transport system ATPase subunit